MHNGKAVHIGLVAVALLPIKIDVEAQHLVNHPKVIERFQEEVNEANEKFGNWEKIKRFELTPDIWTIDGGHLTPTMKLKRKIVKEKYQHLYDKIYNE